MQLTLFTSSNYTQKDGLFSRRWAKHSASSQAKQSRFAVEHAQRYSTVSKI